MKARTNKNSKRFSSGDKPYKEFKSNKSTHHPQRQAPSIDKLNSAQSERKHNEAQQRKLEDLYGVVSRGKDSDITHVWASTGTGIVKKVNLTQRSMCNYMPGTQPLSSETLVHCCTPTKTSLIGVTSEGEIRRVQNGKFEKIGHTHTPKPVFIDQIPRYYENVRKIVTNTALRERLGTEDAVRKNF